MEEEDVDLEPEHETYATTTIPKRKETYIIPFCFLELTVF